MKKEVVSECIKSCVNCILSFKILWWLLSFNIWFVNVLLGFLKTFLHIKVLLSPQRYQKIRHMALLAMFQGKLQNPPIWRIYFVPFLQMKFSICNKLRKLLWRNSANLSSAKQTEELTYLIVSFSSLVSYLRIFCECPVSAQHSFW